MKETLLYLRKLNHYSQSFIAKYLNISRQMYAKYENYDAINVNEVCEIPKDYFGLMGVPITFLDKFCPEQFEIVGCAEPATRLDVLKTQKKFKEYKSRQIYIDGILCQKHYHRLLIRRKKKKKSKKSANKVLSMNSIMNVCREYDKQKNDKKSGN